MAFSSLFMIFTFSLLLLFEIKVVFHDYNRYNLLSALSSKLTYGSTDGERKVKHAKMQSGSMDG